LPSEAPLAGRGGIETLPSLDWPMAGDMDRELDDPVGDGEGLGLGDGEGLGLGEDEGLTPGSALSGRPSSLPDCPPSVSEGGPLCPAGRLWIGGVQVEAGGPSCLLGGGGGPSGLSLCGADLFGGYSPGLVGSNLVFWGPFELWGGGPFELGRGPAYPCGGG